MADQMKEVSEKIWEMGLEEFEKFAHKNLDGVDANMLNVARKLYSNGFWDGYVEATFTRAEIEKLKELS
jgi:hypothetical protein